ncbi:hypothetical protein LEP1GSC115_0179 [Leptospira interrogans serovar Australis str. 200703203]|uniref:Uncharacterized protein n=1 Tax=Leptospira interrogans serovar Australis str. 200703203 TaxID=1085541 RepID=N1UGR4_LEPIR|nr:hypothetical protein LEP1GSC115_0179 [Leptospira interrogans serovar Australis str. 200703203]
MKIQYCRESLKVCSNFFLFLLILGFAFLEALRAELESLPEV